MSQAQISSDIAKRISTHAKHALDTTFVKLTERSFEGAKLSVHQNEAMQALVEVALERGKLPKTLVPEPDVRQQALARFRTIERPAGHLKMRDSRSARALAIRPFREVSTLDLRIAEDSRLQILVPPYADQWTSARSSGGFNSTANANAATGTFGFLDGTSDGSAGCGAGVWVQFIPDAPLPRFVQVRSYTPYNYQWHDNSQFGYTAHNNAGFGVFVLSWDMLGNDQRLEQDYRYPIWSDGTGWWEDHHNPSWDDHDFDNAYQFGNEAPYFEAQPGRIYRACLWCFGSCDAGNGYFGNAFADAAINAQAVFVVIGEQ